MAPRKRETTVKQVLSDARETNFGDEKSWKKFQKTHAVRLSKGLGSNGAKDREHGREALHEVADSDQFVEYAAFTEWAIKNHGHLLDLKSDGDLTPLHLAIRKGNHRFVELVLEHTDADRIASLLSHRANPDLTCLHFAIKYRSPFTETFIARAMGSPKTSESNPAQPAFSLALTSGSGPDVGLPARTNIFKDATTPLHMAMTVNEADDSDEYEDSDDDLSDDGSDLGSTEDDDDGDGSHSVGTNSNSGEWYVVSLTCAHSVSRSFLQRF